MASHGGKREGAGRPLGSKDKSLPGEFIELTPAAIKVLGDKLKMGDVKVAMYIIDQVYGKARQRIEQTGADGQPQQIQIVTVPGPAMPTSEDDIDEDITP